MELQQRSEKQQTNQWITISAIVLMLLCSVMTGMFPQKILSLGILFGCFILFCRQEIYLAYPFMIFYNELYGILFGFSVYRLFSFLLVASLYFRLNQHKKFNGWYLIPLLIYFLYSVLVMFEINLQRAVFSFFDVICCLILISYYIGKYPSHLKKFFIVYILVALCAFVTGSVGGNTLVMEVELGTREISRFMATFEDPNYMGLFYTTGIFAMISLKLFKPVIRILLTVVMYVLILASASMTAIVANIVLWLAYLFIGNKIGIRSIVIGGLVAILAVNVYQYGLEHPDSELFGSLSYRIEEKIDELQQGDMASVTTGRTDLTQQHLDYFKKLPLLKRMFGGTPVNASYIAPQLRAAAHNEYVDWLLNIGWLGSLAMIIFLLYRIGTHISAYKKQKDEHSLCLTMMKCTWICYAATLTMFLDYRFMLLFLI